jgi:hypothetical protein
VEQFKQATGQSQVVRLYMLAIFILLPVCDSQSVFHLTFINMVFDKQAQDEACKTALISYAPCDGEYERDSIKSMGGERTPGTCCWIESIPQLLSWVEAQHSQLLWIIGAQEMERRTWRSISLKISRDSFVHPRIPAWKAKALPLLS